MQDAIFFGLLGVVALAPLPLGSNRPWSWFLLSALVSVLLAAWSAGMLLAKERPPVSATRVRWAGVLFAGVCTWVVIQWIPWGLEGAAHPLWSEAGRALGRDLPGRITVNPEETVTAGLRLVSYGAVFWLSLQLCRSPVRARRALRFFVCVGFVYALYGLFALYSGSDEIFGFRYRSNRVDVTSTFINRNSYATFAGLALLASVALYLDGVGAMLRKRIPSRLKARQLIQRLLGTGAPLAVAILVMATALLLTASRAGLFSALLGIAVLMIALNRARELRGMQAAALGSGLLLAGILVFLFSGQKMAERLGGIEATGSGRAAVYVRVVDSIGEAPLLGTGYGTFPDVFPMIRDDSVPGNTFWRRAHNTYLENALELGVPAALALFAAVGVCAGTCWRGLRRRRRARIYPALGVAATALVAAHSMVDFSLQIPAVAVAYAFVLGLGCAQSFPTARHPVPESG